MKCRLAAAGAVVLALTLGACGAAEEKAPTPVKTETRREVTATEKKWMLETEDGRRVFLRLNGSRAAEHLASRLPLTVMLENFSDNEKIFYPPETLPTEGTPKAETGKPGTPAYYAPWGDVALFYGPFRTNGDLYELGTVESAEKIANLTGKAVIKEASE